MKYRALASDGMWRMRRGTGRCGPAFLCGLLLLSLPGCGGKKEALRGEPGPPASSGPRVAVAPMENMSNDLDASEIIRGAFVEEILRSGWNVMPPEESDRLLRERLGISYGGQLGSTGPDEVCRALEVKGVFYGVVREFRKTTTGIYNHVTVTAEFRLFGDDGAQLWEGQDTQQRTDLPRGGGRDLGAQILVNAIGGLLLNPMTPYGRTVGRRIAATLPHRLLENRHPGGPEGAGGSR